MICSKCGKNPAVSHIHTFINGVVSDTYLCAECAEAEKKENFGGNDFFDILASVFGENRAAASEKKCECCGSSFSDIASSGRVGCGNCYKVFADELAPSLQKIHGRTSHIGKKAGMKTAETIDKSGAENSIESLKKKLKEAIEREEYEKAAVIRDEIKKAEGEE